MNLHLPPNFKHSFCFTSGSFVLRPCLRGSWHPAPSEPPLKPVSLSSLRAGRCCKVWECVCVCVCVCGDHIPFKDVSSQISHSLHPSPVYCPRERERGQFYKWRVNGAARRGSAPAIGPQQPRVTLTCHSTCYIWPGVCTYMCVTVDST